MIARYFAEFAQPYPRRRRSGAAGVRRFDIQGRYGSSYAHCGSPFPQPRTRSLVDTGLKRMGEAIASISKDALQQDDFYPWEQGIPMWREIVGNIYMHPIVHLAEWHIKRGNPARAAEIYQET